jgi:hypothetical protein
MEKQNFTLVVGNSYYSFGFLSLMKRRVSSRWDRGQQEWQTETKAAAETGSRLAPWGEPT